MSYHLEKLSSERIQVRIHFTYPTTLVRKYVPPQYMSFPYCTCELGLNILVIGWIRIPVRKENLYKWFSTLMSRFQNNFRANVAWTLRSEFISWKIFINIITSTRNILEKFVGSSSLNSVIVKIFFLNNNPLSCDFLEFEFYSNCTYIYLFASIFAEIRKLWLPRH